MDPKELSDYLIEGIKWLSIGGISTYVGVMLTEPISYLFSERIKSQEDLDRISKEEAEKLGLKKTFKSNLHENFRGSTRKLDDGTYEINIGGYAARRSVVRHELYHVHKGHPDFMRSQENRFLRVLDYYFRQEPQAILYEIFRLRL